MKTDFESLWQNLKSRLWAYALRSISYHDAEDVLSVFSVYVWQKCVSGDLDDKTERHREGYLVQAFKHRVIDFVRSRNRKTVFVKKLKDMGQARHVPAPVFLAQDLRELADRGLVEPGIVEGLINGLEQVDIVRMTGLSKATVSRRVKILKEEMKHNAETGRFSIEITKPTKEGRQMTVTENGDGQYVVSQGKKVLAKVATKDGKITAVVMSAKDADKDAVIAAVKEKMGSGKPAKAAKPAKSAKPKKTAKPAAKAKPAKKAKAPAKAKKAAKPVEKITVSTLKGHLKACGEGKCQCGCGKKVKKRFLPGHDMRLKSRMKADGSSNAKALAKAYGWDKIIKWS